MSNFTIAFLSYVTFSTKYTCQHFTDHTVRVPVQCRLTYSRQKTGNAGTAWLCNVVPTYVSVPVLYPNRTIWPMQYIGISTSCCTLRTCMYMFNVCSGGVAATRHNPVFAYYRWEDAKNGIDCFHS